MTAFKQFSDLETHFVDILSAFHDSAIASPKIVDEFSPPQYGSSINIGQPGSYLEKAFENQNKVKKI